MNRNAFEIYAAGMMMVFVMNIIHYYSKTPVPTPLEALEGLVCQIVLGWFVFRGPAWFKKKWLSYKVFRLMTKR